MFTVVDNLRREKNIPNLSGLAELSSNMKGDV
jgi:hypothetical protein